MWEYAGPMIAYFLVPFELCSISRNNLYFYRLLEFSGAANVLIKCRSLLRIQACAKYVENVHVDVLRFLFYFVKF